MEYEYAAFISYKREDEKMAVWQQKSLECYSIPSSLRKEVLRLPKSFRRTCFLLNWYRCLLTRIESTRLSGVWGKVKKLFGFCWKAGAVIIGLLLVIHLAKRVSDGSRT